VTFEIANDGPTIDCPDDITVQCKYEIPAPDISLITATDNCYSNLLIEHVADISDGNKCPEIITRIYSVTNICGNTDTCEQLIIIDDATDPLISCPPDTTVQRMHDVPERFNTIEEFIAEGGEASDNCGIEFFEFISQSISGHCPRVIERIYQVTDSCGNVAQCIHQILQGDTIPPEIICPPDTTVLCVGDIPAPWNNRIDFINAGGIISDNAGIEEFNYLGETRTGNCPLTVQRVYEVVDSCKYTAECIHTIIVNDTVPPVINCPNDITVDCITDVPLPYTTFTEFTTAGGTASDNCGLDESTFNLASIDTSGNCPGTIERKYEIADSCGYVSFCIQTIIVDDTIKPVFENVPNSITVQCTDEIPSMIDLTWTDNCDGTGSVTGVDSNDGNSCPLTITRTWTYTDACGNEAIETQFIIVNDTILPQINCPPDKDLVDCDLSVMEDSTGLVFATDTTEIPSTEWTSLGLTATDNCGIETITYFDTQSGNCPIIITRIITAIDTCGNQSTCIITITIDQEEPIIFCPTDTVLMACTSQTDIESAYNNWIAGFTYSGGCNAKDNKDEVPALEDITCGGVLLRMLRL